MSYVEIDPILDAWTRRNGLHVFMQYRDEEVRSVHIVDDTGDEYQLWLTPLALEHNWTVAVTNNKGKHLDVSARADELESALEKALTAVNRWITEAGHTRTPVL
jgi:hypothetical protein